LPVSSSAIININQLMKNQSLLQQNHYDCRPKYKCFDNQCSFKYFNLL